MSTSCAIASRTLLIQSWEVCGEVPSHAFPHLLIGRMLARNTIEDGIACLYHRVAERPLQSMSDVATLRVRLQCVSLGIQRTERDEVEPLACVELDTVLRQISTDGIGVLVRPQVSADPRKGGLRLCRGAVACPADVVNLAPVGGCNFPHVE